MNNFIFYILNILLVALPLALFEISIEKNKGWGGGFPKDKWYAKCSIKGTWLDKVITAITGFESPLNYHLILMIGFHLVFILEYIFFSRNILLIIACYLAVDFFADLCWFSFNWYFHSMRELLKGPNGSVSWHKKWIRIGKNTYLPKKYPMIFTISLLFLIASQIWK